MLLNIDNFSFAYGVNDIFTNAKFRIDERERVGLVGKNGIGKSTFIKLLTNELYLDEGSIEKASFLNMGYLEQMSTLDENKTVYELFLDQFQDIISKENRLRELEELFATATQDELDKYIEEYGELQHFFEDKELLSYESLIKGTIVGLGFSLEDLNKKYSQFSGGEKTKLNLGLLLLQKPDLILLDEPTNFLDIQSLSWLENFLKNYDGSFIITSHDRYFLDKVCTRIDEIENYQINSFSGNYTNYVNRKQKLLADQNALYKKTLKEYQRQKEIIRRYRDINSKQSSKHARSREKVLEKMEVPTNVASDKTVNLNFKSSRRSGDDVLTVKDLEKSFDNRVLFKNLSFEVKREDRIGIIGENGIGKSTLFNILRKKEKKDKGDISFGTNVSVGWFDQETKDLEVYNELDLIETIREDEPLLNDGEIRSYLAGFLFTEDDVFKKIKDLSGGEKVRIKLAKLMLKNSNFLILDEPTNHIDMATKEILENALNNFDGTILVISHDRYFLNKITNKIFEFTPESINEYLGNYDSYIAQVEDRKQREALALEESGFQETKTSHKKKRQKLKELKKEIQAFKRTIKLLEESIETTQEKINEYEEQMANKDFYLNNVEDSMKEYNLLKEELSKLMESWEENSILLEEKEEEVKQYN